MCCYNIGIILGFLSTIFSINQALNVETIIGGYRGRRSLFKYQAAILGKVNYSNFNHLICGGAIISENMVLSASQCFLNDFNELRELRYSVVLATNDLKKPSNVILDVIQIYFMEDSRSTRSSNDIAVVQINGTLNIFSARAFFQKVEIPEFGESFFNREGIVSGYGFNRVNTTLNIEDLSEVRVGGETDFALRYANVRIIYDSVCRRSYPTVFSSQEMCGLMLTDVPRELWGTCTGDAGGPLIINNTVVGIVSKGPPDCNDTLFGSIYTKVSAYSNFIRAVLDGMILQDTVTLHNRIHIPPRFL